MIFLEGSKYTVIDTISRLRIRHEDSRMHGQNSRCGRATKVPTDRALVEGLPEPLKAASRNKQLGARRQLVGSTSRISGAGMTRPKVGGQKARGCNSQPSKTQIQMMLQANQCVHTPK